MPSDHAAVMDADGFWRQFPVTVRFDEPEMTVKGRIVDLTQVRVREDYLPRIRLQQKDGTVLIIVVGQTRLLAELVEKRPAKGDWLKIVYHGEAKRAAPGMNPTKEFTVEVARPGQVPQFLNRPDEPTGEVSENDKGAGGNSVEGAA